MHGPRQDRYSEVLHELREMRKELKREQVVTGVYSKDFVYFAVSLFIPLGYGEVDLIPHESIAHPIVGWICWTIPVVIGLRWVWHWLSTKGMRRWVNIALVVVLGLGFCLGALLALKAWVNRRDQEEQEEVSRNLTYEVLPPLTENVMESVFSIANRSSKTTISSGQLFCGINWMFGEMNGQPRTVGQLSSAAIPNASRLTPGDSRSEPCLMLWSKFLQKTSCVDMKLWMRYTIEPQPNVIKEKSFHLVGYQARGGNFNWYPETLDSAIDYCDYFKRQIAPPD